MSDINIFAFSFCCGVILRLPLFTIVISWSQHSSNNANAVVETGVRGTTGTTSDWRTREHRDVTR